MSQSECESCDKSFRYNGYLKRHLRKHTVMTPYKCDRCNKSLTQTGHF